MNNKTRNRVVLFITVILVTILLIVWVCATISLSKSIANTIIPEATTREEVKLEKMHVDTYNGLDVGDTVNVLWKAREYGWWESSLNSCNKNGGIITDIELFGDTVYVYVYFIHTLSDTALTLSVPYECVYRTLPKEARHD